MWFTPIVWNLDMLSGNICVLFKAFPFTYLVEGFREAFISSSTIIVEHHGMYTAIFWAVTILMFVWGDYVFRKNKKDFADVL